MQVQTHRHRLRRATLRNPDPYRAIGRRHRHRHRRPGQFAQRHGTPFQVERCRRMRGVLHQRPGGGRGRLHVGRLGPPCRGVIVERRAGRDHRAEVHLDPLQLAGAVEPHARLQVEAQLVPSARPQRVIGEPGDGDAVHDARLRGGPQHHGVDGPVGIRVGQRVQPAARPAGVAAGTVAGFAAAVGDPQRTPRRLILGGGGRHLVGQQWHCRERTGAPADARLLDREAAPDRVHIFATAGVAQHVVGHMIAELVAVAVAVGKARQVVGRPVGHVVHEDQVAGGQTAGCYRDRRVGNQEDVSGAGRTEQKRHAAERLGAEGALQGGRRGESTWQRGALGVEGAGQRQGLKTVRWWRGHW